MTKHSKPENNKTHIKNKIFKFGKKLKNIKASS